MCNKGKINYIKAYLHSKLCATEINDIKKNEHVNMHENKPKLKNA